MNAFLWLLLIVGFVAMFIMASRNRPKQASSVPVAHASLKVDIAQNALTFLLSKFTCCQSVESLSIDPRWPNVLGTSVQNAVGRLLSEGLIRPCSDFEAFAGSFGANEYKQMLRERNLKVSGNKPELAARLYAADPNFCRKAVREKRKYVCTDRGEGIARAFMETEDEREASAKSQSFEILKAGRFEEACQVVAAFQLSRAFPMGVGVDWSKYDVKKTAASLRHIFSFTPAILKAVPMDVTNILRPPAAMLLLWGINSVRGLVPENLDTGTHFDPDITARMLLFSSLHRTSLEEMVNAKLDKVEVEVGCDESTCSNCRALRDKVYSITKVPALPYEHCTSKRGCRCTIVAFFDD
jgi:hypothetical protein